MKETALPLLDTVELRGIGKPTIAKLIERKNNVCIYERDDNVFEVFTVKISEAEEFLGRSYPKRETYPSNEDFGKIAWCYTSFGEAMKKFKQTKP